MSKVPATAFLTQSSTSVLPVTKVAVTVQLSPLQNTTHRIPPQEHEDRPDANILENILQQKRFASYRGTQLAGLLFLTDTQQKSKSVIPPDIRRAPKIDAIRRKNDLPTSRRFAMSKAARYI